MSDDLPEVIEGGLHVEATAAMLLVLADHLPKGPGRGPMGTVWYVSGTNTPEITAQITPEVNLRDEAGRLMPATHCQSNFTIADGELVELLRGVDPAHAKSLLMFAIRAQAASCLAGLKQMSPGITDLHWIGPSRQKL